MRHLLSLCLFLFFGLSVVTAQDIATLEKQATKEKAPEKLADIHNLLAQAYLKKDGEKTIFHAEKAISFAEKSKNNTVKAEALSFQAKATAGIYAPDNTVPNRNRNKSARQYHDAKNLYGKSLALAKKIGYTQLELDNLENLAYINTKKIGRHDPDKREEVKYYKQYISRIKDIKKVTKPKADYTVTGGGSSSNTTKPSSNGSDEKPQSSGSDKFIKQMVKEKEELKDKVYKQEREIKTLEKEMEVLNNDLKKALDSGTSKEEIERIKAEQEKIARELKYKNRKDKERFDKETKKLTGKLTASEMEKELLDARSSRLMLGTILGGIIAALVLAFLYFGYRSQSKARKKLAEKNEIIAQEQERSEDLLLNILPKNIAEELKTAGAAKARRHDNVTVFFSDFKNFTKVAEALSPEGLVKELDYCFKGFDYIISQYPSIEKIKTIGDAYMCCSGLSGKDKNSTSDMVKAAMDMQEFLYDYKADRQGRNQPFFEARIGIHTGPVVAGVVGNKKFAYDVWGDTVNVASRMESSGDVGKVNVSADTYNEIRYQFSCHPRGKIQVKNKGMIEMYFVDKVYT